MAELAKKLAFAGVYALVAMQATAVAATVSVVPPNQTVAKTPVVQFQAVTPSNLPATGGHPAVGTVFAIQSYSSSQNTPTSPAPAPSACVSGGSCPQLDGCVNNPTWPTIAQSISWWQAQNQSLKGSYAYTVGSTYSHQDAEGWIDHCSYTPQPACSSAAGWTGSYAWVYPNWVDHCSYKPQPACPKTAGWTGDYTWVYPNWVSNCHYQPQPSCPRSAGWTGSYTWNGSFWVDHCIYTKQPPCPGGAGWTGSYYWAGSYWASGCSYQPQPRCPANYSGGFTWTGTSWADHCTPNRCPTGAGWTGYAYPNCYYQPQPSCPGGDSGSYTWNGAGWVDNCINIRYVNMILYTIFRLGNYDQSQATGHMVPYTVPPGYRYVAQFGNDYYAEEGQVRQAGYNFLTAWPGYYVKVNLMQFARSSSTPVLVFRFIGSVYTGWSQGGREYNLPRTYSFLPGFINADQSIIMRSR